MNLTLFQDAYVRQVHTITQPDYINLFVANALKFVIQNVFINISNSFTITISTDERKVEFWFYDLMSKLHATWGFMAVNLVVLDNKLRHIFVPGKRFCNMILIDSYKSLEKTNIAEFNRNYDSLEYYFIFLQNSDDRLMQEMENIFQYCFANYWIHCNIMIQNSEGKIYIYTYFPFRNEQCFQTHPILINQFIKNRFKNAIMFPDKLKNFHLCPLKLSSWKVPPFIMYKQNFTFPQHEISGFEMMMIYTLAHYMNFTIDINMINLANNSQNNESLYKGPLENLRDHETNISLGYFRRTTERDTFGTPSFITYHLPLVAIVLRKQQRFESIGLLTFPFDTYTWCLMGLCYGSLFLINFFQRKLPNKVINRFEILKVFLGVPTTFAPKSSSRRIHFALWIFNSFILRSVYQSLLFYLFRTHFYKSPPLTLDALAEAGYKAVCTGLSQQFVLHVPHILNATLPLIALNSPNEMEPLRYLERYPNENLAAMTILDFAYYYVATEMLKGNALQVLPINVNDQQVSVYFTKHSYLIDRFNDYILYFQQAGLLEIWQEWTNYGNKVTRRSSNPGSENNELMINLKQLLGFFLLTLFLQLTSVIIFILELLSTKFAWLKKLF